MAERELTDDEVRDLAFVAKSAFGAAVPTFSLGFAIRTEHIFEAAANNAMCAFLYEPRPLSVDVYSALRDSLTQAVRVVSAHSPLELSAEQIERACRATADVVERRVREALSADTIAVEDEGDGAVAEKKIKGRLRAVGG